MTKPDEPELYTWDKANQQFIDDHDWHAFKPGWEVARIDGEWHARRTYTTEEVILAPEAFDAWRSEGPNPEGVD